MNQKTKIANIRKDLKLNVSIISIEGEDIGFYHLDFGGKNLKRKVAELDRRGFKITRPLGEVMEEVKELI